MATPKKALLIEYELDWVESKLKEFSQLEKEIPSKKYIRIIDGDKHRDNKYYCYSHILLSEQLPFYIGIGTQNKKGGVYSRAKTTTGRNKLWHSKVKNEGYLIVINSSSNNYEWIKQHEIDAIEFLGKKIDGGLLTNISDGGDGCLGYKHTEEHLQKLREAYTGVNNPMFGKKASEETRQRMSKSQTGRKQSEYTKKILSDKKKERGYQGQLGKDHPRARKVYQLDSDTKDIITIFDTIRIAANEFGVTDHAIGRACKLGFKVKGFNWSYSNNYNKDFFITNKKIYKKDLYRDRIIEDFKKGDTIAGIARRYNLGETTCSRIIKGN